MQNVKSKKWDKNPVIVSFTWDSERALFAFHPISPVLVDFVEIKMQSVYEECNQPLLQQQMEVDLQQHTQKYPKNIYRIKPNINL